MGFIIKPNHYYRTTDGTIIYVTDEYPFILKNDISYGGNWTVMLNCWFVWTPEEVTRENKSVGMIYSEEGQLVRADAYGQFSYECILEEVAEKDVPVHTKYWQRSYELNS